MKKNICFISCLVPQGMQNELARDFFVVPLPPDPLLDSPVASHPDMIMSVIGENIVLPRTYYEANHDLFHKVSTLGYQVTLSDAPRSKKYPSDVGLNAAVGEDYIICRSESTSPELLECAKIAGKKIIDVKQGYAGCSCIVTDRAVLTSDTGIHRALTDQGIDSTYVDKDGISLPGYDVGFIGGCGGYHDGTLYFFGSLNSIACGNSVKEFAKSHEYKIRELSETKLTDYGGIKILYV